jgi:hypothetical protein
MSEKQDILYWLQDWYQSNCDGNWEHNQNILILTIDNPGWSLSIKLEGTLLADRQFEELFIEKSETDWYCCRFKNSVYLADGGLHNLLDLIAVFKTWVQSCESNN